MQSRQSDFLFSLSRAFGVLTEIAVISVIQRDFSEKLRRLVSPGEAHMTEWRVLGQNVSRANPEKTIQIARRFATVRTTTRGMAIDPECATRTVKTSGGQDNQGFLNTEPKTLRRRTRITRPSRAFRPRDQVEVPADARRVKTVGRRSESCIHSRHGLPTERHRLRAIGGFPARC